MCDVRCAMCDVWFRYWYWYWKVAPGSIISVYGMVYGALVLLGISASCYMKWISYRV